MLYVSIPWPDGAILALLDANGLPRPGWPIAIPSSTSCPHVLPVRDGSVRVICDATDIARPEIDAADVRAYAIDGAGRLLPGWPVELRPGLTARVIGDDLRSLSMEALTDVEEVGQVDAEEWTTSISAKGSVRDGVRMQTVATCCGRDTAFDPIGIAYGTESVGRWDAGDPEVSRITALGLAGPVAGWPVMVEGSSSRPSFGPVGRIVIVVGSTTANTTNVLAVDSDGRLTADSGQLPVATADNLGVDCKAGPPFAPLISDDSTAFVVSVVESTIFALDRSLAVLAGWPYQPPFALARHVLGEPEGLQCPSLVVPAIGPGAVIYLTLQARDSTVGDSLVALGRDGQMREGWPIELRRAGAEFWAVAAGDDATVFSLAVEPETGGTTSATILALAPDSSARYRTTIVEP